MSTKTLILAAAAVLTLGAGSAFADGDGSGNSYFDSHSQQPTPPAQQYQQYRSGQSAGDATSQRPGSDWMSQSGTGGGG